MHFYYFLPFLSSDFHRFFCAFLRILWSILRRPSRSSNLVPRLAVVGVVLLAILTDHSSLKQINTLIMIMQAPADGVEPSQWPCRARDGVVGVSTSGASKQTRHTRPSYTQCAPCC